MTPSEEVRKLLDELGVEHRDADETIGDGDGSAPYGKKHVTRWFHHGMECTFAHSTYDDGWEETVFDGGLATDFTPAQAIAATVGRSCESCPEMDNPDSYIRHLQSALKWHDEHVPRPTNPRNTCVVLEGEKPPEEVLFVHEDGSGVTHYVPENVGTCHVKAVKKLGDSFGFILSCGHSMVSPFNDCPHHCPWCGAEVVSE